MFFVEDPVVVSSLKQLSRRIVAPDGYKVCLGLTVGWRRRAPDVKKPHIKNLGGGSLASFAQALIIRSRTSCAILTDLVNPTSNWSWLQVPLILNMCSPPPSVMRELKPEDTEQLKVGGALEELIHHNN